MGEDEEREIGPRETVYDERISPLMVEIIKLCKEHDIGLVADFQLDLRENGEPLFCTTAVPPSEPSERWHEVRHAVRPRHAPFVAMTIFTGAAPVSPPPPAASADGGEG